MNAQQAQTLARDVLTTSGFADTVDGEIVVSDDDESIADGQHVTTPTRLEAAADQYRLITGESVDIDSVIAALDWV